MYAQPRVAALDPHKCDDSFTPLRMRRADDGDLFNAIVFRKYRFHDCGEHIDRTADYHELLAVEQIEEAVLVHLRDVIRAQPAALAHNLGRLLRAVEITLHHRRSADPDFALRIRRQRLAAGVSDRTFEMRSDAPDRF